MRKQLTTLQTATNVVTLGLDYQRYAKFNELTGHNRRNGRGDYIDVLDQYPERVSPSIEDCHFCFDFVVEGAIRIQRFGLEAE